MTTCFEAISAFRPAVKRLIAGLLLVLTLATMFSLGFLFRYGQSTPYSGHLLDMPAPGFWLTDVHGRQWQLEDFRGHYVFLMFGYLNCTDTCHSQALVMQALQRSIADRTVRYVYISMDPQRDSDARLKHYFSSVNDQFVVLRSDNIRQLQAIANRYRAPFSMVPSADSGYQINHPGYMFMIDPDGRLALVYPGAWLDADSMYQDLVKHRSDLL